MKMADSIDATLTWRRFSGAEFPTPLSALVSVPDLGLLLPLRVRCGCRGNSVGTAEPAVKIDVSAAL